MAEDRVGHAGSVAQCHTWTSQRTRRGKCRQSPGSTCLPDPWPAFLPQEGPCGNQTPTWFPRAPLPLPETPVREREQCQDPCLARAVRGPRPSRSCPGSERSSEGSSSGRLCGEVQSPGQQIGDESGLVRVGVAQAQSEMPSVLTGCGGAPPAPNTHSPSLMSLSLSLLEDSFMLQK